MTPTPARELSIGGLRFSASEPPGVRLIEDDPTYREFLDAGEMPGETAIAVEVELGGAPDTDGSERIFDAGTWSAHRAGGETVLRLRTDGGPDPYLWVARIPDAPGEHLTIHCGSRLQHRTRLGIDVRSPLHYPLDQLLASHLLAPRRGVICHAAGVSVRGRGILFAGRSGAGKTTFMRLVADRPADEGPEIEGLSDDRIVVRRVGPSIFAYGTPWAGEGRVAASRAVPLEALVFLHQSADNRLVSLSVKQALEQLLPVVSVLWFDAERMVQSTSFCGDLVATVPTYELHFRPDASVWATLRDLMA